MNKSMLAGIGIGVAAALGVAAVASLNVFSSGPKYAQVISATPIKETVKTPHRECRNVAVTHRRPVQDENRITGSLLGAVAGGVIGHQFGGGHGKDIATVAGALGGGYAGNQIQGSMQNNDTYTTTQQRCKTVYDKSEKMLGYDVTYKIGDQQGKIRMDRDPGTQIPLDNNGQLVLNKA
ncbi:glycine zipper 2TM domain-containing protein [Pluralibacter gergoviae]|uniref:glycine zipper 2TM domain-containing protein n=1 Tax=Pluralibacter gergoviae TaxID=61647 RepID=UPI00190A572E|nr:glycine zipper 2TM domain-containing protein [Pluralibacter gergoviae]MBK4117960.1 glycine zipper 2TM domain-containing protein [Pluralibacter gergoviae]